MYKATHFIKWKHVVTSDLNFNSFICVSKLQVAFNLIDTFVRNIYFYFNFIWEKGESIRIDYFINHCTFSYTLNIY